MSTFWQSVAIVGLLLSIGPMESFARCDVQLNPQQRMVLKSLAQARRPKVAEVIKGINEFPLGEFNKAQNSGPIMYQSSQLTRTPAEEVLEYFIGHELEGLDVNGVPYSIVLQTAFLAKKSREEVAGVFEFFTAAWEKYNVPPGNGTFLMAVQTAYLTGDNLDEVVKFFMEFPHRTYLYQRTLANGAIIQSVYLLGHDPAEVIQAYKRLPHTPANIPQASRGVVMQLLINGNDATLRTIGSYSRED